MVPWQEDFLDDVPHAALVELQRLSPYDRLIEQVRRQDHQGVEPSASLIEAFRNEICGETLLELVLVLVRIVLLCVRHCARFKPAVKDLIDALQHALSFLGRNLDVIDEMTMNVRNLTPCVLL